MILDPTEVQEWLSAIRPGEILSNEEEYDDIAPDGDYTCAPCLDDSEEAVAAKAKKSISQPTKDDIESHEIAHVPFRSWCKFCIMDKGIASAHKSGESQSSEVPIVGVDYAFTGSRQQKNEEKGSPVMVITDKRTQRILARMVPQKGRSKYAIKKLSRDIDQMGYKNVILKSDNEEALLAVQKVSQGRYHY